MKTKPPSSHPWRKYGSVDISSELSPAQATRMARRVMQPGAPYKERLPKMIFNKKERAATYCGADAEYHVADPILRAMATRHGLYLGEAYAD